MFSNLLAPQDVRMMVQARFPYLQIPDGEPADAPEKIDNSKVWYIYCHLK